MNTFVGVVIGVHLSFEAVEEPEPTLVVSNFLITDEVNLLISLMTANFTDMWSDFDFDLFFLNEALLFIGVAIFETIGSVEPFCNNSYYVSAMFVNDWKSKKTTDNNSTAL